MRNKQEKKIFYIGQQFKVKEKDGDRKSEPRIRNVRILRLCKNFALCRVNERYNECFDYQELGDSKEVEY